MKINEVLNFNKPILTEARARIDHPEDIIFDENGLAGAERALNAIEHAISDHSSTTVKWDGSPAVIFGWLDKNNFIVTDKAGIGAKKYDGRPVSADALSAMIYNRKPDQLGRAEYAAKFAGIYELLKKITPKSTAGKMFQGDMLWMTPNELQVSDTSVAFRPNKINYSFGIDQDLGRAIKKSQAGLVIHGVYDSADAAADAAAEPTPTTPSQNKISGNSQIIVFGPETQIPVDTKIKKPKAEIESLRNLLKSPAAAKINDMFDPYNIGSLKITNFPDLFKSFINFKAGSGQHVDNNAGKEFVAWIKSPASKVSVNKQENILAHIAKYKTAYDTAWKIVAAISNLKHDIKDQFDRLVSKQAGGIQTASGHEGYVAATPHGKIKFVNRPAFMKKE
jgi:hypothetical protein